MSRCSITDFRCRSLKYTCRAVCSIAINIPGKATSPWVRRDLNAGKIIILQIQWVNFNIRFIPTQKSRMPTTKPWKPSDLDSTKISINRICGRLILRNRRIWRVWSLPDREAAQPQHADNIPIFIPFFVDVEIFSTLRSWYPCCTWT